MVRQDRIDDRESEEKSKRKFVRCGRVPLSTSRSRSSSRSFLLYVGSVLYNDEVLYCAALYSPAK